ncbi:MAG TPA: hypothetical protein VJX94_17020 [Stellaceae bacterium]|nr:hypothetical protein [Stellaceae bacterium]
MTVEMANRWAIETVFGNRHRFGLVEQNVLLTCEAVSTRAS